MTLPRELETASTLHAENNDCAVKALAIVTGADYATAHAALAAAGRKRGKGTTQPQQIAALKRLGFRRVAAPYTSKTVKTLAREMRCVPGVYTAHVRSHVLAIKDGAVLDWTAGRQHRMKALYRIVPIDGAKFDPFKRQQTLGVALPTAGPRAPRPKSAPRRRGVATATQLRLF